MASSGRTGAASGIARHKERLRAVVEPVVTAAKYDLEDLEITGSGRRSLVRVVVDSDQGVDSDAVAELSRDISAALDAAERAEGPFTRGSYHLEVSSPGIDRPLTQPRHWRRNRGRLVKVKITTPEAAPTTVTGRILAADDERVRLKIADEVREVPYSELGPGKVQIEFNPPTEWEPSEDGDEHEQPRERDIEPGKEEV